MPRLKPLLKYPRISAATLRPGAALSSPPVLPFGKVGTVRLLPGWECLGWSRVFNTTPPYDVAVFEKKECLPAPGDAFHQYGPGIYWASMYVDKVTIELLDQREPIPVYKEGDAVEPPSALTQQLLRR